MTAYSTPPTVATGDVWSANLNNTYMRDNFSVTAPGIFTAKGQLFIGTGAAAADVLAPGSDGQVVVSDSAETTGRKAADAGLVPVGGIVIWSGSVVSIPTGWQICDGTGGTPDLRDKFLVCSGSTYATGDTGGAATANLQHDHDMSGLTDSGGAHTHTNPATPSGGAHAHNFGSGSVSSPSGTERALTPSTTPTVATGNYGGSPHTHSVSGATSSDGAHAHNIPDTASGGAHTHVILFTATLNALSTTQNMQPPYYALAYIMRMS